MFDGFKHYQRPPVRYRNQQQERVPAYRSKPAQPETSEAMYTQEQYSNDTQKTIDLP